MNDCLFEPFYSTFTISLLARPRCPTGRVIRIYSVHFQSQLYLSQSFLSGAPRLELGPTVLETAMLPLTPCSYYQRRGQELHLPLVVLQTTPSLFGYLVKNVTEAAGIEPVRRFQFYGWMENRTPATLITQDNFQDCYPCQLGVKLQITCKAL